jgi:trehalose 6-phosphate synthase
MERQRESIAIRTFLWTFHYLHDTSTSPVFDDDIRTGWDAYREVNRAFANALSDAHHDVDDVVLVHDFHLMLVPGYFSSQASRAFGRLAYFHHVPWCQPDYLGILPDWMVIAVLESLLTCDTVGFHCDRWGDAFLACCDRFLPGVIVMDRRAVYRDHETVVTTAPGPIDALVLDELNREPATEQWRQAFLARAGGRRVIARVDRLDLWKNLIRGFAAYKALFERRPELSAEVWLCAVVTVPRLQTDRHRQYQALCEGLVLEINDRYASGREAASLLYPEGTGDQRNRAVAALSIASATLVNPTFDGLNMVAKEAVVVNPEAALLLSTNAGAFPQLASLAVPVPPFDVMQTADALELALDGETPSREAADPAAAAVRIRADNGGDWLQAMLRLP